MARFCGKCGSRIEDGMTGCPKCSSTGGGIKRTSPPPVSMDSDYGHGYYGGYSNDSILVSSDEVVKERMTSSYAGSFIRGDGLSSSEAICTNRRFYFKGTCYDGMGIIRKSKQEWVVDLKDITSSGFKHSSNIWFLLIAIVSFFCFFIYLLNDMGSLAIVELITTIILGAMYYFSRKTLYVITFAGGWIAFNASQCGEENAHRFNKILRVEKEKCIEQLRR